MAVIKKYKYALLLIAILVFHAINNYNWIRQDEDGLGADVQQHINLIISLRQGTQEVFISNAGLFEKCKALATLYSGGPLAWPRFFHSFTALVTFPFFDPRLIFLIRFSNMFYFAILVISIYLLGKNLFSPLAGALAAFFISFYPGIYGLSRQCGLDFPLISMVSLAAYFLIKCNGFQNRYYSVLFGLTSGLGMLVKGQFAVFIIGPFLNIAYKGFSGKADRKKFFFNILISAALAMLISLIWWSKINFVPTNIKEPDKSLLFISPYKNNLLRDAFDYLRFFYYYISPVFFAGFLTGLFFYLRSKDKFKSFFLLWLLPPYLFFVLFVWLVYERYIFPAFGVIALISAAGLLQISFKKIRTTIIIFLLLFGILQFFRLSFFSGFPPLMIASRVVRQPEKNNHWQITGKFNRIIQGRNSAKRNIAIIENGYFKGDPCTRLGYCFRLLNDRNKLFLSADGIVVPQARLSKKFLSNIDNYDFLVAFSRDFRKPDFSGLLIFSSGSSRAIANKAIEKFGNFKILERDILWPEEVYVFLLERQ